MDAKTFIKNELSKDKVVIFSKTYCPYCTDVKKLFKNLGVSASIVELDDKQYVLQELGKQTGAATVPRVFINSEFVGGCDDCYSYAKSGKLQKLLTAAGITVK